MQKNKHTLPKSPSSPSHSFSNQVVISFFIFIFSLKKKGRERERKYDFAYKKSLLIKLSVVEQNKQ